uniref:Uncharacterized protein n=1 Tax=Arion vulgaris TaxID=1028688 RepID=A0A0B7AWY6_9EUPU
MKLILRTFDLCNCGIDKVASKYFLQRWSIYDDQRKLAYVINASSWQVLRRGKQT